eukprot:224184-Rhodomonas_salina.1
MREQLQGKEGILRKNQEGKRKANKVLRGCRCTWCSKGITRAAHWECTRWSAATGAACRQCTQVCKRLHLFSQPLLVPAVLRQ